MKYLPLLVLLALGACAEHHDLTECTGPYLAMAAPTPPVADGPPAPPVKPSTTAKMANAPDAKPGFWSK